MAGRVRRVTVLLAGCAAFGGGAAGAQDHPGDGRAARPTDLPSGATILDVPYFPQTELLCGGAATAMVLRYWGMVGVRAEDFADLVRPSRGGMRADELAARVRELGWEAFSFAADFGELRRHLRLGRPVVSLIQVGGKRFHYVVVVGEAGERLVVHDPAGAPYRLVDRAELEHAWDATEGLSLLVLPPPDREPNIRPPPGREPNVRPPPGREADAGEPRPSPLAGRDALPIDCRLRFDRGLSAAAAGRLAEADDLLAGGACADDPVFLRELAGVRLRRGRTAEAADLAGRAATARPDDTHAARTLATALYVNGRESAALDAWNRVGEPEVDLVRIAGLDRVAYRPVADLIGLAGGDLLTSRRLALARRRLASLPAAALSRVTYAPTGGGRADLVAAVAERSGLPTAPVPLAAIGLRAAIRRELRLTATSPLGRGETWTAGWRWWEARPAVSFEVAAPAAFDLPAIWTLAAGWERESYRFTDDATDPPSRDERTGASLGASAWIAPALRIAARGGHDRWRGTGSSLRGGLTLEARISGDRLRLVGEADHWVGLGAGPAFGRLATSIDAATRSRPAGFVAYGRGYLETVGEDAPRTTWPGAGGGIARRELLRAHPLLDGGVVTGPAFDRHLAGGSAEVVRWLPVGTGLRLGPAAFVDAAHTWGARRRQSLVDVGLGLRLTTAGGGPTLRLDGATGLSDDEWAITVGLSAPD